MFQFHLLRSLIEILPLKVCPEHKNKKHTNVGKKTLIQRCLRLNVGSQKGARKSLRLDVRCSEAVVVVEAAEADKEDDHGGREVGDQR